MFQEQFRDRAIAKCLHWLEPFPVREEHLDAQKISGGITNVLYRVWVKTEFAECVRQVLKGDSSSGVPGGGSLLTAGVGVRFFDRAQACELVDREEEAYVISLLSNAICKSTYYHFRNGQIDEWLSGRNVTIAELKNFGCYTRAVAQHLAKLHRTKYQYSRRPDQLIEFAKLTTATPSPGDHSIPYKETAGKRVVAAGEVPGLLLKGGNNNVVRRLTFWVNFLTSYDYSEYHHLNEDLRVFYELYEQVGRSYSVKEVLCHNDLLNGNIVLTDHLERGTPVEGQELAVEFIDHEYSSLGFNAYDLANHLVETADEDWRFPHPDAYVREFAVTYLEAFNDLLSGEDQQGSTTACSGESIHSSSEPSAEDSQANLAPSLVAQLKIDSHTKHKETGPGEGLQQNREGEDREGEDRESEEQKGKGEERKGEERKGEDRQGEDRQCEDRQGEDRVRTRDDAAKTPASPAAQTAASSEAADTPATGTPAAGSAGSGDDLSLNHGTVKCQTKGACREDGSLSEALMNLVVNLANVRDETFRPYLMTEALVDEFVECIKAASPLTHFFWSVWALVQNINNPSDVACNFAQFSATRYQRWSSSPYVTRQRAACRKQPRQV
ncbi:choline/ethanolamine kinase [Gregarina niphandrodes]|uniref:ethanolamine kinase n=1 Tax=Gregarina niphandrodes TaxID=110365 RepID=A0A023B6I6_GRENI|nr:choline/ethanolamine kinase [Gregarina niphandrodes]EZG66575.1 choline/ethanolamine kinase [Gregarina niphandrodes]|eukprot:XP_011130584.1 choline/ethanolamine kinase [Gregarina niphandrodes]